MNEYWLFIEKYFFTILLTFGDDGKRLFFHKSDFTILFMILQR